MTLSPRSPAEIGAESALRPIPACLEGVRYAQRVICQAPVLSVLSVHDATLTLVPLHVCECTTAQGPSSAKRPDRVGGVRIKRGCGWLLSQTGLPTPPQNTSINKLNRNKLKEKGVFHNR
ncbi:hypothetical protein AGOR_G00178210 [Albula goreensis]|uniref:Uncharacterized protein n=1 Tax=Albula goreensis TaxID=1534307 RepID=A0A8T3D0W0_9TELE|nr:hypothetical protein AGOR_G00178210 [Albula goreensis]